MAHAKILAAAQRAANAANSDSNDGEIEALRDALELALDELGLTMPDAAEDAEGDYCIRCGSPESAPDPTCGECPETDRVPCQVDNSCTYIAEDEDDLERHITEQHPNTPVCEECGTREDAELIHGKVFCPACLHDAERSGWTGQEN